MTPGWVRSALAAGALLALVTGCGDDDGDDGAAETAGTPASTALAIEQDTFEVLAGEGVVVDLDELATQIEARLTAAGQEDVGVEVAGDRVTIDPGAGVLTTDELHQLTTAPGELTFRPVLETADPIDCSPDATIPPAGPANGAALDETGAVTACFSLGPPADLSNAALEDAQATFADEQWVVSPVFTEAGIETFNAVAAQCSAADPSCPTSQLAIVVDGVVLTSPTILQPAFERDQIQISGDFTEGDAKALAAALAFDPLPGGLEVAD